MTGTLCIGQNASLAFEEFLDDVTNVECTFWARNGIDADHLILFNNFAMMILVQVACEASTFHVVFDYLIVDADNDDVTYEESTFC